MCAYVFVCVCVSGWRLLLGSSLCVLMLFVSRRKGENEASVKNVAQGAVGIRGGVLCVCILGGKGRGVVEKRVGTKGVGQDDPGIVPPGIYVCKNEQGEPSPSLPIEQPDGLCVNEGMCVRRCACCRTHTHTHTYMCVQSVVPLQVCRLQGLQQQAGRPAGCVVID